MTGENLKGLSLGFALALCVALDGGTAKAGLIGAVGGPDWSSDIDIVFDHKSDAPSADIISLSMDGGTAASFPVTWKSIGSIRGDIATPAVSGLNTRRVTFTWGGGGFSAGDEFKLSNIDADGDFSPLVVVDHLVGVTVAALFADGTEFLGEFVDDDSKWKKGLQLVGDYGSPSVDISEVPLPATAPLLGLALAGLGFVGWRRRNRHHDPAGYNLRLIPVG